MSDEYRAKVFKSGNSVALRLPKALGLKDGDEMVLREDRGKYAFEPVPTAGKKTDLTGIWGSCPGLKPVARVDFDPSPRIWDDPDWPGWSNSSKP